ncbi:uncharacterized protein LOC142750398 [Rhinoderma darwinii]|uniref:uncharacterized protein LOC142750398 n=1 Tax=Rhinoderma darwinii TaxID=43563 RepID=UPI003F66ABA4
MQGSEFSVVKLVSVVYCQQKVVWVRQCWRRLIQRYLQVYRYGSGEEGCEYGFIKTKPKKTFILKSRSIMGTGASKTQKENTEDNEERATMIQNRSASTLPENTSIRQQIVQTNPEDEEISEDIEQMVQIAQGHQGEQANLQPGMQIALETEDVSVTFESFQHQSGTLYTCFTQNGIRMYFDDEKGILPFPQELYSQGKFLDAYDESGMIHDDIRQDGNGNPSYLENDRTNSIFIPGKGMVMTYIFEERINVCKYYDNDSDAWLILPLLWEMNLDFILHRVQQVKEALPAITDFKEILAALRLCNYDPDEVISMFLAMFGDSLQSNINGQQNLEPIAIQR